MKKYFWIALSFASLGVTSCKDDVTFDQGAYDDLIRKAYPVENVDPTHQWATVGVANTNITVNTGSGDNYKVKIYRRAEHVIQILTTLERLVQSYIVRLQLVRLV